MTIKTWRRVALVAYFTAGALLAAAAFTWGTTAANAAAVDAAADRIATWHADMLATTSNAVSADSVGRGDLPPDTRPYVAPRWPALARRVMPSVVALGVIERPHGVDNHAWQVPGTRRNLATRLLTRLYGWQEDWAKEDARRRLRIICAGVVIGPHQVLTVAHCLDNFEVLKVRTTDGQWRAAHVIGVDVSRDVGVLRIEGDPLPPIAITTMAPRQGQDVMVLGSPGGYGFAVGVGVVAWYGRDATLLAPARFMLVTASVIGGDSGGVVVNTRGEAVSLVSYGHESYTQTIPIARALAVAGRLAKRR